MDHAPHKKIKHDNRKESERQQTRRHTNWWMGGEGGWRRLDKRMARCDNGTASYDNIQMPPPYPSMGVGDGAAFLGLASSSRTRSVRYCTRTWFCFLSDRRSSAAWDRGGRGAGAGREETQDTRGSFSPTHLRKFESMLLWLLLWSKLRGGNVLSRAPL